MKEISIKQLIASEICLTLGMGLMPTRWGDSFGSLLLGVSTLIMTKRADRSRPVGLREAAGIFVMLLVFAALLIAAIHFTPDGALAPVERLFRNPVFLLPLWLLSTWFYYRIWKHANAAADAA